MQHLVRKREECGGAHLDQVVGEVALAVPEYHLGEHVVTVRVAGDRVVDTLNRAHVKRRR